MTFLVLRKLKYEIFVRRDVMGAQGNSIVDRINLGNLVNIILGFLNVIYRGYVMGN